MVNVCFNVGFEVLAAGNPNMVCDVTMWYKFAFVTLRFALVCLLSGIPRESSSDPHLPLTDFKGQTPWPLVCQRTIPTDDRRCP
jgi:hypothetical protein